MTPLVTIKLPTETFLNARKCTFLVAFSEDGILFSSKAIDHKQMILVF